VARRKKHGPDVPASALQALTAAQEFHNALAWAKDGDPRLLRTILAERGFSYYERDALVRALAPAKKGPGRPRKVTRVTRWAEDVDHKRAELRAQGVRHKVFEKALAEVARERHDTAVSLKRLGYDPGPPFDEDKVRQLMRRSRQPRRR
jgi:hypothetical protein